MIDLILTKTFWLTLTNIGLGLATLSMLLLAAVSLVRDFSARQKKR